MESNKKVQFNLIINFLFIQTINDEHEEEHLIDETRNATSTTDIRNQPTTSTPTSPYYLSHARSDTNLVINIPPTSQNEISKNNNNNIIKPLTETKRAHSMFTATKCSPS